jgi:UPF0271 protein
VIVLDTSAFLAGFNPFSVGEDQVTTPKVEEEIRSNSLIQTRFRTAAESGRLQVREPSEECLEIVEASAIKVGDAFYLSETDKQVLAIAIEAKRSNGNPQIVTDDYSIQNVATNLGIAFAPLAAFGIRRLLEWVRYCPACYREYSADCESAECTVCGTELKRKPRKKLKTLKM